MVRPSGDGGLDVVLLGMGDDGHTASLFPGAPQLEVTDAYVMYAGDEAHPHPRITFTFPASVPSFLVA